jgi:hypothetical protein
MNTNYTYIQRMEQPGFKVISRDKVKSYKEFEVLIDLANKYENNIIIISDSKIIKVICKDKNIIYSPDLIYIMHKYNIKISTSPGLEKVSNYKLFFKQEYLECIICYTDSPKGSIICQTCSCIVCLECHKKNINNNCPIRRNSF